MPTIVTMEPTPEAVPPEPPEPAPDPAPDPVIVEVPAAPVVVEVPTAPDADLVASIGASIVQTVRELLAARETQPVPEPIGEVVELQDEAPARRHPWFRSIDDWRGR